MRKIRYPIFFRRLLTGWLLAAALEYLLLPAELRALDSLSGLTQMSLPRLLAATVLFTLLLYRLNRGRRERVLLPLTWAILSASALTVSFSWPFLSACVLVLAIFIAFAFRGWNGDLPIRRPKPGGTEKYICVTLGLTLAFFAFVSLWTLCRLWNYNTPTYDFGIFSQMFHFMKETGQPLTTLERDGLLSHFAVHVSPIYYLMLPLYILFPYPETLQLQQAAVMASAVIPLWKLGKIHGLDSKQRTLLCALLLLYPAFSGGAGYDLHENCFLTPCILWLFYGIDRKWGGLTAVSALLTLLIKEDAPVYTAVIGLWLLIRGLLHNDRWEKTAGTLLFAGSLSWFFCATAYLARFGDGVMTGRYNNLIYDGSGSLFTVIKAVLLCPMKALYECADQEKLEFLALTMLPLLGLPLLTRRYESCILLIPYLLLNLMSDYRYQHDIFFQYTFGSTACLMYLTLGNLPKKRLTASLTAAVLACAFCFCWKVVPKAMDYPVRCIQNFDRNQQIGQLLEEIPADASVSASTFYTTALSARDILYDIKYSSTDHVLSTDYVVLSHSDADFASVLTENGFVRIDELEGVLTIYQKNGASG